VVIVPEEVAKPVHGQASQLAGKPAASAATKGRLYRDDDVPEKHAVTLRIGFSAKVVLVKAEHVGGAVELAIRAIESADLWIAGEQQRDAAARTVERTQSDTQALGERASRASRKSGGLRRDVAGYL